TRDGKTRVGKRIFQSQAVLIYKKDTKADIAIGLLPGQKNLYQSQVILLPVVTDQTFVNRKGASSADDGLRGERCEHLSMRSALCSSFFLAALFHERLLALSWILWHIPFLLSVLKHVIFLLSYSPV